MAVLTNGIKTVADVVNQVQGSRAVAACKAAAARAAARLVPGDFWYGKYPHTFLERRPPLDAVGDGPVPNVIWCFWTGDNPLTPARRAGLESIRSLNPETLVELVDPGRLPDFILPGRPLHPAFDLLSLNHRSDYLRAYFLFHYGGGYADLKTLVAPWAPAMGRLEEAPGKWVAATALSDPKWAGNPAGRLGVHVRRYYERVASGTTCVARRGNPLFAEWLREIDRVLDYAHPALLEAPGGMWGQDPAYPLEWMALQGNVFQPLCLKYQDRLILDPTFAWDESVGYR